MILSRLHYPLRIPFWKRKITSHYAMRQSVSDPSRGQVLHNALDLRAPSGTKVVAAASGVVTGASGAAGSCGGLIQIEHSNRLRSTYCHLREVHVQHGQRVRRGQVIGLSGGAASDPGRGNSRAPHLHYELAVKKGRDWKYRLRADARASTDRRREVAADTWHLVNPRPYFMPSPWIVGGLVVGLAGLAVVWQRRRRRL